MIINAKHKKKLLVASLFMFMRFNHFEWDIFDSTLCNGTIQWSIVDGRIINLLKFLKGLFGIYFATHADIYFVTYIELSIVESLCNEEVACSTSDLQGSNF